MESSTNDTITMSCMNLPEHVGHKPLFSCILNIDCCLAVRFGLNLISGWVVFMHTYL